LAATNNDCWKFATIEHPEEVATIPLHPVPEVIEVLYDKQSI
jgi:hypothetical protein